MLVTLTGLIALALLVLVMLPPLRITALDRLFGGLPRTLRAHHLAGVSVTVVAALHAALAMSPYIAETETPLQALSLFFDRSDLVVLTGSLALASLVLTLATSFWIRSNRARWLLLHRTSFLGLGLVGAHIALVWSPGFTQPLDSLDILRIGLAAALLLVALTLVVHFVRPELLGSHRAFTVTAVNMIAEGTVELTLRLSAGLGAWRGGEFGFFRFDCRGPCGVTKERHPFTVVDVGGENEIRIVVKALGDDTGRLQKIVVGTSGELAGPYGSLEALRSHRMPQLWIAGGLGLMPFLGFVRRREATSDDSREIDLVYLYRQRESPLYLDDLRTIEASSPHFHVHAVGTAADAEAGIEVIKRLVPDFRTRDVALAGPRPMIDYWTKVLRSHGVPRSRIYTEDYSR